VTLLAIVRAAFEEYRGLHSPPSGAHSETVESLTDKLAGSCAVLAYVGSKPAGCVFYDPGEESVYLHRLAVLPHYRGRGIARQLIEYVEGRAAALGRASVRLGTRLVLARNRAFYARLGYREYAYGERLYDGKPFYVMLEKAVK
jgi:GNAT superfamily N-acetyltransferase